MKVAIINDQHFGVRGDNSFFLDNQEKFYDKIFFPELEKHNIKTVLDLGDTFDRRKYINFVSFRRAQNMYFDKLEEKKINVHSLVGNHSTYYKNTNSVNNIKLLLDKYTNFKIYESKPVEIDLDGLSVLMVPWICQENEEDTLKIIAASKVSILMGHFEIQGYEMVPGRLSETGLDREIFFGFDSVFSGHFHHPSEYQNIKYLGAPYEMNWADFDGKRGFHIFDTETLELTFVKNPYKMFHKIYYNDEKNLMSATDIQKFDASEYVGGYVKIIVEEKNNPYIFDLFVDKIQIEGAIDIKIVESALNFANFEDEHLLDEAEDTLTIMDKYVDNLGTIQHKEELKMLMRNLYQDAISL